MVCTPDSQLLVRRGMEAKAAEVWATASRAHVNLDFTFGSQPLAARLHGAEVDRRQDMAERDFRR